MAKQSAGSIRNVVLVHGGFVDGSGWEAVYRRLRQQGFTVSVVQNPTTSLADDVKATRWILAQQDGPVILVGHSYGGVVITEAGNDPTVAGLVYVAAFAPDAGESVASLSRIRRPGHPSLRSSRHETGISCWTSRSSPLRSPPTSTPSWRRSWEMLRCPGVWRRSKAR